MRDYQITAIRPDPHDADRLIDGVQIEGTIWPVDKVIDWIRSGTHLFWIQVAGDRVRVIAVRHWVSGRDFLTTAGEGFPPHNLLNQRHVH